ncbi:uncharacterized protein ASPGLDRAFT_44882 [Aspergillus glaucus CBS 516.65]|uniref:Uncharacterized protein n=1 Tax=Aspergillus glaucus CBS 516.65 TaxID=1160497 RepID=A0A1L9VPR8_ASPGL|nr:hypothetical protein ASPGLDRAFT_44882 [Aspergillus glaucus CBS 516.65]OJJ85909.1 hypothetical protein ASPGLDRAFT_44882 [Aspergillus glaucus CBS 516.65]
MPQTTKPSGITPFLKNTPYSHFPPPTTPTIKKPLYHTHLLTLYILLGFSTCIHFSTKTLLWLNFLTLGILILTNLQMDE